MTKQQRKSGGSKRHAEAETLEILGTKFAMGPLSLVIHARWYSEAATRLPATDKYSPVPYYLAAHAIELSLKAFLALQNISVLELTDFKYGHDLTKLLDEAYSFGLQSTVSLSATHYASINGVASYYKEKVLEYPSLMEAMRGYSNLPNLTDLVQAAEILTSELEQRCLDHSNKPSRSPSEP
jgi:hypothetical protein